MRVPGFDLDGEKAILKHLQISRTSFRRLSRREVDPLPVAFVGGRTIASSKELDAWALKQVRRNTPPPNAIDSHDGAPA